MIHQSGLKSKSECLLMPSGGCPTGTVAKAPKFEQTVRPPAPMFVRVVFGIHAEFLNFEVMTPVYAYGESIAAD